MTDKEYEHEDGRIKDAIFKANGDTEKFEQLIINRAQKCGLGKLTKFVTVLQMKGYEKLANRIIGKG